MGQRLEESRHKALGVLPLGVMQDVLNSLTNGEVLTSWEAH
jgi:hypothetical protein